MRPRVVSHLNATDSIGHGPGVYFLQEKSRNVSMIAGLLIKYSSRAESPI